MSNNFLNNYGKDGEGERKKADNAAVPSGKAASGNTRPKFKYEQRSSFKKPERREPRPSQDAGKTRRLVISLLSGGVVLAAILIAILLFANRGVAVIDLTGWTLSDAQLWANQNNVQLQTEEVYNDQTDENVIITQSTAAGTKVNAGDFIRLTISKGHDLTVLVTLPDLKTMTSDKVEAWAAENFMTKVRITTEFSDTVASGSVIRYEVNDSSVTGDKVKRNSPVYVIVSKGPESASDVQVTVPNFKTMVLTECYTSANELGLTLTVEEEYDDYVAEGSIISQSVKADQKVSKGSGITLIVSKGKKIIIPDFSTSTKDEASAKASGLGIPVVIEEKYSGSAEKKFISQSIDAGSIYQKGDTLQLTYSLGNKVALTSYVGQTRDVLETWASGLNAQGASITIKATYTQSSAAMGTIIWQDKANVMIGIKTTINITVSSGKVVYVPDFVSDGGSYDGTYATAVTREEAISLCEAAGIIPVFVAESTTGRLPDEIWYQSVAAGTEGSEGMTVTLKYVPSATVSMPNIVNEGLTQAAAQTAYGAQFTITFAQATDYVAGKEGLVVSQSLTAGTTVASGTAVTLYLGPAAAP